MKSFEAPIWKKEQPLVVGMYALHQSSRSSLVRISDQFDSGRFGVEYVSLRRDGQINCGGGSFSHGLEDFVPLSEAWQILTAEYYEAKRQQRESEARVKEMETEASVRLAAISAMIRAGVPIFDNCGSPVSAANRASQSA